MKLVLFVEGVTEKKAIPQFLKRWLDSRTSPHIGIQVVKFEGWPELVKDSPRKARLWLQQTDVVAVIALLDLYGLGNCPPSKKSASERLEWARRDMEGKVGDPRFFQFFAVHEVEAWLLSDLSIFPGGISSSLKGTSVHPEDVDLDEPPARLLNRVYKSITGRNYLKVTYGQQLFKKLDPSVSYAKCPHLKQLLDKMLDLAQTSKPVSG